MKPDAGVPGMQRYFACSDSHGEGQETVESGCCTHAIRGIIWDALVDNPPMLTSPALTRQREQVPARFRQEDFQALTEGLCPKPASLEKLFAPVYPKSAEYAEGQTSI